MCAYIYIHTHFSIMVYHRTLNIVPYIYARSYMCVCVCVCIYIYIYFSIMVYHRTLNIVSCIYARSYMCVCVCVCVCVYTHTHFSIMVYHRILNIVPYAIGGLCCVSILYNSLPLLVPKVQSFLPPWQPQDLFSMSTSQFCR